MNKPHKHAELIRQWTDGAEIEVGCDGEWFAARNPTWRNTLEYRIKPKPKWKPKHTLITAYMNSKYKAITVPQEVHTYDTLLQFVSEHETDWGNQDCEVYKCVNTGRYKRRSNWTEIPAIGIIRMSKQCADKLCEILNSGEIEL